MTIPVLDNPIELFMQWFEDGKQCGLREPTAMALATVDEAGAPDVRMVLLKSVDDRGFVFYTNLGSVKAQQLTANPHAALCFYWTPLGKQIRVRGEAVAVSDEEADAYFASRDRQSQIGAYASKQSHPLETPHALEKRAAQFAIQFGLGKVPRPDFWSGFRIVPNQIEFWLEKPFRLHERLVYTKSGNTWTTQRLYP
ncbi:MAG: pyridoxine/pyridoxamine 5'-phosphate oxidase [Candidatus Hydrogenedentota bacterium]